VTQALAALGARVALPPPAPGDWGLVGRHEDLARLHKHLGRHDEGAVVPVAGTGGIGKTALAIGYVAAYGDNYNLIVWLDAERPEAIAAQYSALVLSNCGLNLPEVEAVAAAKALLVESAPSLVVFDNATSYRALHPYLPSAGVNVLVTTRNETWTARRELVFELEHLPETVVEAWLERELPGSDVVDVAKMSRRLGGLPLAVVQALAYIDARTGTTATSYVRLLETKDGQRRAYGLEPPPGYPQPVASTWDVAFDAIGDEAPVALELLRYLAFVSSEQIPIAILEGLLPDEDVPELLAVLRRYGLVRSSDDHLRLHRLVQEISRWPLNRGQEARYIETWATHLVSFGHHPEDPRNFAWFADLAAHVLSLIEHAQTLDLNPADLAQVATKVGVSLEHAAALRSAESLFERILLIYEAFGGPGHPDVAAALGNLGNVREELGDYEGAIAAYERAMRILETAYGTGHPQVATTLTNLGIVRDELGDLAGAEAAHRRALSIYEQSDSPNHRHIPGALINLGIVLNQLGDHVAAVDAYQRALAIVETTYGPNDPQVASALTNLGVTRKDTGDYAGALAAYERALVIREAAYGPEHPSVAMTLDNLGNVRWELRDPAGALEAYERAAAIFEAAYGPDHPDLAVALGNIGVVREELGDRAAASAAYERALRISEASYGRDHERTASARERLDRIAPNSP
jgi:Tfp pilus assembly protein PilF